jgi:hypothetical protein
MIAHVVFGVVETTKTGSHVEQRMKGRLQCIQSSLRQIRRGDKVATMFGNLPEAGVANEIRANDKHRRQAPRPSVAVRE